MIVWGGGGGAMSFIVLYIGHKNFFVNTSVSCITIIVFSGHIDLLFEFVNQT